MSCQHFKENHAACTDCNRNPIVNAEEKGKKYSLKNPSRKEVCKIRVDKCVIQLDMLQCDYLLLSCDKGSEKAFFVELKGSDLSQAIKQLDRSIDHLKLNIGVFSINARAVLYKSPTPDLRPLNYKKFREKIARMGGTFVYKSKLFEETLD